MEGKYFPNTPSPPYSSCPQTYVGSNAHIDIDTLSKYLAESLRLTPSPSLPPRQH